MNFSISVSSSSINLSYKDTSSAVVYPWKKSNSWRMHVNNVHKLVPSNEVVFIVYIILKYNPFKPYCATN